MLEFPTIAEANAYAARSGAAMVVTDGTGAIVYCLCDEVPESLRPHNPTEEPIYVRPHNPTEEPIYV